jgi:hypothetical protein
MVLVDPIADGIEAVLRETRDATNHHVTQHDHFGSDAWVPTKFFPMSREILGAPWIRQGQELHLVHSGQVVMLDITNPKAVV